jgi:hypothetical protein
MKGNDAVQQVMAQRTGAHRFIKWWRKDNDFVDFELIDTFLGHVKADDAIDGFELLDMERMWDVLLSLNPDTLSRGRRNGEEIIRWTWLDRDGSEKTTIYPFTAEALMTLIDTEFFA